jgi:hypothetical protein
MKDVTLESGVLKRFSHGWLTRGLGKRSAAVRCCAVVGELGVYAVAEKPQQPVGNRVRRECAVME